MGIAQERAQRAEQVTRALFRAVGAYAPPRAVCVPSEHNKRDVRGADYWASPYGIAIPVEVKSETVLVKTWESKRNPYILSVRALSDAQLGHLDKYNGWLSFVMFLARDAKTNRARIGGWWFAPWRVWDKLRGDGTGWRRTHLEQLTRLGYYIRKKSGVFITTPAMVEFGNEVAERSVIGLMWTAYETCKLDPQAGSAPCSLLYQHFLTISTLRLLQEDDLREVQMFIRRYNLDKEVRNGE